MKKESAVLILFFITLLVNVTLHRSGAGFLQFSWLVERMHKSYRNEGTVNPEIIFNITIGKNTFLIVMARPCLHKIGCSDGETDVGKKKIETEFIPKPSAKHKRTVQLLPMICVIKVG